MDSGQPVIDSGPVIDGSGAACPPLTDEWVGAFITLNVTWAPVLAANGGSGTLYLWSLNHYTINGSTVTGTTRTCGNQVEPLVLNATGKIATDAPADAGTVAVLNETPTTKVWDHDTRTTQTTGILGGWNVGSSLTINPTTSIAGLSQSSTFSDPNVAWPTSSTTFATSDFSDDDNDGNPGITAYPLNDNAAGYYYPATALGSTAAGSTPPPGADKLYVVSRTQVAMYGTSTSCTDIQGKVTVPEYLLHVIGCHDHGTAATASCMPAEWQFIDSNVTVYAGSAGKQSVITGTFDAKLMSADGGPPSCDDVVAAFPSPMPQPQGDQ
jgi:hypothetical protein